MASSESCVGIELPRRALLGGRSSPSCAAAMSESELEYVVYIIDDGGEVPVPMYTFSFRMPEPRNGGDDGPLDDKLKADTVDEPALVEAAVELAEVAESVTGVLVDSVVIVEEVVDASPDVVALVAVLAPGGCSSTARSGAESAVDESGESDERGDGV